MSLDNELNVSLFVYLVQPLDKLNIGSANRIYYIINCAPSAT